MLPLIAGLALSAAVIAALARRAWRQRHRNGDASLAALMGNVSTMDKTDDAARRAYEADKANQTNAGTQADPRDFDDLTDAEKQTWRDHADAEQTGRHSS